MNGPIKLNSNSLCVTGFVSEYRGFLWKRLCFNSGALYYYIIIIYIILYICSRHVVCPPPSLGNSLQGKRELHKHMFKPWGSPVQQQHYSVQKRAAERQIAICPRLPWGRACIGLWSLCLYLQIQPSEAKQTNKPTIRERIIPTSLCRKQNEIRFLLLVSQCKHLQYISFLLLCHCGLSTDCERGGNIIIFKGCSKPALCLEPGPKTTFLTSWIWSVTSIFL